MYRAARLILAAWLIYLVAAVAARPAVAADSSAAAWATIRAKFPTDQPLPRPTWLPDRFRQPGQAVDNGLLFGVFYTSDDGDTLLFGRTANSCAIPADDPSQRIAPILVQGVRGIMTINTRPDCSPPLAAAWLVGDNYFSIQANPGPTGVALIPQDLLTIIAGLAATLPNGAPTPTPLLNSRPDVSCFRETGQCLAGPFRAYWEANGGLARNGLPLTGEMVERIDGGRPYQVQYFERVRLKFHPENADPAYQILLGQFGRRIVAGVLDTPTAAVTPRDGSTFFAETGHNVGPRFGAYWRANGGLAQFGLPLTELFEERLEDGKRYQVQYFERARFEYHPENEAPYDVQLGQFGRRILNGTR